MESAILALALATCAAEPEKCSTSTTPKGETLVAVCGLAPEKEGVLRYKAKVDGQIYFVNLKASCNYG